MKSNKKLIVILSSFVGGIILLIIILMLIANGGSKSLGYEKIEKNIVSAGKNYFKDHEDKLPSQGTIEINASKLISEGYLSDFSKRVPSGVTCSGTLAVSKTPNDYSYRSSLNCGDDYKTQTLSNILLEKVTTSNNGLYAMEQVSADDPDQVENVYIFRGDAVNNYIKLGDFYWRIVKVYEDGEIAVLGDPELLIARWDNRYNIDTQKYHGINIYDVSRMKDSIKTEVLDYEDGYKIIKSLITTHTACYGKRSLDNTSKDGSVECQETLKDQYFSLLPVYDFMNASLDPNCQHAEDNSCYNYNYLAEHSEEWWTLTGVEDDSENVYFVDKTVEHDYASTSRGVRLYAHFAPNVKYISGSGTEEDPYVVE